MIGDDPSVSRHNRKTDTQRCPTQQVLAQVGRCTAVTLTNDKHGAAKRERCLWPSHLVRVVETGLDRAFFDTRVVRLRDRRRYLVCQHDVKGVQPPEEPPPERNCMCFAVGRYSSRL